MRRNERGTAHFFITQQIRQLAAIMFTEIVVCQYLIFQYFKLHPSVQLSAIRVVAAIRI